MTAIPAVKLVNLKEVPDEELIKELTERSKEKKINTLIIRGDVFTISGNIPNIVYLMEEAKTEIIKIQKRLKAEIAKKNKSNLVIPTLMPGGPIKPQ